MRFKKSSAAILVLTIVSVVALFFSIEQAGAQTSPSTPPAVPTTSVPSKTCHYDEFGSTPVCAKTTSSNYQDNRELIEAQDRTTAAVKDLDNTFESLRFWLIALLVAALIVGIAYWVGDRQHRSSAPSE